MERLASTIMPIKQRINTLIERINQSEDSEKREYLQAVETMIGDCGKYIERVSVMEAAQATARFRLEADEYKELIVRLDRARKSAYDGMMVSVKLVDRVCALMGVEKVYGGPDERILIADFAGEVVKEYFDERRL